MHYTAIRRAVGWGGGGSWGVFWVGEVDSEGLPYRCLKEEYILAGRGGFRECPTVA